MAEVAGAEASSAGSEAEKKTSGNQSHFTTGRGYNLVMTLHYHHSPPPPHDIKTNALSAPLKRWMLKRCKQIRQFNRLKIIPHLQIRNLGVRSYSMTSRKISTESNSFKMGMAIFKNEHGDTDRRERAWTWTYCRHGHSMDMDTVTDTWNQILYTDAIIKRKNKHSSNCHFKNERQ